MSGWIEIEQGNVKIEHWSTSSQIKMIVTVDEEVTQGTFEKVELEYWFDYHTFSNIRKAIEQTDGFP